MEDAVPEAESLLHKQEEEIEQKEEDSKQEETEAEGKDGKERKGGLLDHIIHSLVSPLSPKAGDVNQKKVEVFESSDGARSENEGFKSEEEVDSVNNSGGGPMKNVITNFFHPSEQAEVAENEEETVKSVEENAEMKKEKGGGGGGIIGNIISHLPTSLQDDVAPTTDEASILIHSIIHD